MWLGGAARGDDGHDDALAVWRLILGGFADVARTGRACVGFISEVGVLVVDGQRGPRGATC